MLNLKLFLLITLISFSLQDSHCLLTYEYCLEEKESPQTEETTIDNCAYENDEGTFCNECKDGYAVTYDGKCSNSISKCSYLDNENKCENCYEGYALSYDRSECISFANCVKLEQGNKKCKECKHFFYPNSEGKCERTTCQDYNNNNVCIECRSGYYLKGNECKKISIPYCLTVSDSEGKVCNSCLINLPIINGECLVPENLIKGCSYYDASGKCTKCEEDDYELKNGNCIFKGCKRNEEKVEICEYCEPGFHEDDNDGFCIGYDGTKDTSVAAMNKIQYSLLILIFSLLL